MSQFHPTSPKVVPNYDSGIMSSATENPEEIAHREMPGTLRNRYTRISSQAQEFKIVELSKSELISAFTVEILFVFQIIYCK